MTIGMIPNIYRQQFKAMQLPPFDKLTLTSELQQLLWIYSKSLSDTSVPSTETPSLILSIDFDKLIFL